MNDIQSISSRFKRQSASNNIPLVDNLVVEPTNMTINWPRDMSLIEKIGNVIFLKCRFGHIHKYIESDVDMKCKSCNASGYLINIRVYLEGVFGLPFMIEGNVIYNTNLKICVGSERPNWISIADVSKPGVIRSLRIHKMKFDLETRSRI